MPTDQQKICYMMQKYDSEPAFIPIDCCKNKQESSLPNAGTPSPSLQLISL